MTLPYTHSVSKFRVLFPSFTEKAFYDHVQVLDEADRLLDDLDYNFGEQLKTIFAALPPRRQTLLFSATLTDKLKEVSEIATNKPFLWTSEDSLVTFST